MHTDNTHSQQPFEITVTKIFKSIDFQHYRSMFNTIYIELDILEYDKHTNQLAKIA